MVGSAKMSDITKKQETEEVYYSPLLILKRLFSEPEAKELEVASQAVSVEYGEILEAGRTSLNKFVEKKEAFLRRLEKEREACKSQKAQVVELTEELVELPRRASESSDRAQENDDPEELENWCRTAGESVKTLKDKLHACALKWFEKLEKAVSRDVENKMATKVDKDQDQTSNLFMYVIIGLVCVLSAFFSYGPEDVQRCTEEPMQCVAKDVKDFFRWAMDSYLQFHNISLENQEALNSERDVNAERM